MVRYRTGQNRFADLVLFHQSRSTNTGLGCVQLIPPGLDPWVRGAGSDIRYTVREDPAWFEREHAIACFPMRPMWLYTRLKWTGLTYREVIDTHAQILASFLLGKLVSTMKMIRINNEEGHPK